MPLDENLQPKDTEECYVYLIDSESYEVKDKVSFAIEDVGHVGLHDLLTNILIKRNGGIKKNEKIKTSYYSPEELQQPTVWKRS